MHGQREAGAEDNKSGILMACGPRHVLFTGNSDTPYLGANLDLKKSGAMVIEVPAGPYVGFVDDHNQRWVVDLGMSGADEGKGGKYLVAAARSQGHGHSRRLSRGAGADLQG